MINDIIIQVNYSFHLVVVISLYNICSYTGCLKSSGTPQIYIWDGLRYHSHTSTNICYGLCIDTVFYCTVQNINYNFFN